MPIVIADEWSDFDRKAEYLAAPGYCDTASFDNLVREAQVQGRNVDEAKARLQTLLRMKLCANEKELVADLERSLYQATYQDKKLNNRKYADAVELACRAQPGYRRALERALVEKTVHDYCRKHNVKVQQGLFSWKVP